MSRAALLVLAVLLVGGCRKAPETSKLGSPGDSVAGTGATRDDPPGGRAQDRDVARRSGVPSSLIAVATTGANEAQPCERVCGSLGDCLLADAAYTTNVAGGLELVCLDMCVHSAEAAPAKAEFLACGGQTECGQLQACAERNWTALAAARQGPAVAGVTASDVDPCKSGCRWTYSCMGGSPPGQGTLDPMWEEYVKSCVDMCDQMLPSEREYFDRMTPCLATRCTMEGVMQCSEEAMAGRY
jgi:hypothetical protein